MIVGIVPDSRVSHCMRECFEDSDFICIRPNVDIDDDSRTQYLNVMDVEGMPGCYLDSSKADGYSVFGDCERKLENLQNWTVGNVPQVDWGEIARGERLLHDALESSGASIVVVWNNRWWYNELPIAWAKRNEIPVVLLERGPFPGTIIVDRTGLDEGCNDFQCHRWPAWKDRDIGMRRKRAVYYWVQSARKQTWEPQPDDVNLTTLLPDDRPVIFAPLQRPEDTNVLYRGGGNDRLLEFLAENDDYTRIVKYHPVGENDDYTDRDAVEEFCGRHGIMVMDVNVKSAIRASAAVVTMNSQVGIEAFMAGKPVGVLGEAYWRGCGMTVDDPVDVAAVLDAPMPTVDELFRFLYCLRFQYLRTTETVKARVLDLVRGDYSDGWNGDFNNEPMPLEETT